ncbi:MAG: hypothetical protein ACD_69C00364G0002 [uncultured bacterium]|nr:MAG: hypothetical protein ACD_69C00364G0002 [uncultured bacterium]
MLTLSLIKNAAGAAQYYAKEDNYYLSEANAKETSSWWGKGASELGLSGKVEEKELQELLGGKLPNGVVIGLQKNGKTNHRSGYDLCFHAPKSVSILALDGEDKRFYNAHLDAVKETLKIIERDCAQSKVYKKDQIGFENTKNLTVALVRHTASRELDPHLHHHALVMNVTKRQDNAWRALASSAVKNTGDTNGFSERVYKNQIYYGLIYQSSLANKVVQLGCEIETVGPHGLWEIKGVSKEARELMSKRRQQIEERIEKLNYRSKRAADVAALDTREEKPENLELNDIKKTWKEELASVGFSSKEFIAELDKSRNERNEKSEKSVAEKSNLEINNTNVTASAKEAVKDAIAHLSQYNLKLDYAKIISQSLEFAIGKNTHGDVVNALNDAVKEGLLIPLDKPDSMYVTKELIEIEKTIMDMVGRDKGIKETKEIGETKGIKETKEKNAAIDLKSQAINSIVAGEAKDCAICAIDVLQSRNRLSLIESRATDNAEFISAILKLAESSGKTVRILSPNRMMANDVNENIKRKPSNLWQWLISLGKPDLGESIAGFKHKYKEEIDLPLLRFRQGKDVIVVNSAETLGCDDMHSLLELTEKTSAKVIFLRDLNAKQGFGAGNSIETLKQAGIETFKINAAKRVIGYVPELKSIQDNNERTKQLARAYALKEDKDRDNTIVFVGSREQLKTTNEAIREELKNRGKLFGIEHSISVLNPIYMSKPEATLAHRYQKNMIIRFYEAKHAYEDWKVGSINKEQNTLRLIKDGKRKLWDPKKQAENHTTFKKEILQIARGDKLIATGNMKALGIKNSLRFVVQEIDEKRVKLLFGTKVIKISLSDLKDSNFQYDYATTISRYSKKQVGHILADVKAYSLDQATINELTGRAKESLTIFTNDAVAAQKRFGQVPVKLTATETILDAGKIVDANKVDRFINNKTIAEIKSDIEKAITVLGDQYNLVEKAEKKAVDFAIEKITSRNAGFTHKELVAEALTYVLKEQIAIHGNTVTHEDIMKVIAQKRTSGELVMGKYFDDGTRWTTKKILELERSIISDIKKGLDKLEPLLDQKTAKSLLELKNEKITLTQDQKNACHLITTTKDQFVIIQGYAGTGKTTMFSQVQNMLKAKQAEDELVVRENGENKETRENKKTVEILALAPTNEVVKDLISKGLEAQTLKSFLIEQQRKVTNSDIKGHTEPDNKTDNKVLNNNSLDNKLIILDEASMVSNEDLALFIMIVIASKARAVLSGDIAQHIAIGSGKPLEMIQKANILKIVYLLEIVRQKNPNLKEAVEDVIRGDYAAAFKKIAAENPQNHIKRIKTDQSNDTLDKGALDKQGGVPSDFFNTLKRSIVEIDNNKLKKGEKTLEEMVAEDFLSRTPETRDQTVIIVHANRDRKVITGFIRKGLKEIGAIEQKGIEVSCLIPKGLTSVEHKSLQSYNIGDVVKFGKKYYHVAENDQLSKSIQLEDEVGKTKYFYPEKYVDKYNVELYEHTKAELAVGDIIRLTKTDKERELYANFKYKVKEINDGAVTLGSMDYGLKNSQYKSQIILNPKELRNAHWDYAQTVTGYGFQGGSKTYEIDFEPSYRKKLANQRSFYIGSTRAVEHLTIYTDNKERLLNRILANKGDKYAALEVTGDLVASNNNISHGGGDRTTETAEATGTTEITKTTKNTREKIENKPSPDFYDIKEARRLLSNSAESFVERLLGRPNEKLSSASEWRYGNKGSLAINMRGDNKGLWYDFETGESGDLLALIQVKIGSSFQETLKYVINMLGHGSYITVPKQHRNDQSSINSNNPDSKVHNNKGNDRTSEYAQKLAGESTSITGTVVEEYLKEIRGINNIDSSDIRYHPKVYTGKNEKQKYMPAMLSIGRDKDGNIQCVQATYLDPKTANKADLDVKKRTYSSPSGVSVSLQKHERAEKDIRNAGGGSRNNKNNENNKKNGVSYIAEGVETGLSIKDAVKNGDVVVTLGKSNFATIDPQSVGQKVVFCLDNDGAKSFTDDAIHKAAQRLVDFGKEVFIAIPDQIGNEINGKSEKDGKNEKNEKIDFNDVARTEGINAVRKHIDAAISFGEFSKNFKPEDKNMGDGFANKLTKSGHDTTKQLSNAKNIEQSSQLSNPKYLQPQTGKKMDLEFER